MILVMGLTTALTPALVHNVRGGKRGIEGDRGGNGRERASPSILSGVGFSLYEIVSTHLAFGFLSGQACAEVRSIELVKKAI
jgi:hypothetical protein